MTTHPDFVGGDCDLISRAETAINQVKPGGILSTNADLSVALFALYDLAPAYREMAGRNADLQMEVADLTAALAASQERCRWAESRAESAESALRGCKIALEQAWASSRERDEDIAALLHLVNEPVVVHTDPAWLGMRAAVIAALKSPRAALAAQPVAEEPVAWGVIHPRGCIDAFATEREAMIHADRYVGELPVRPLYAHPAAPAPASPEGLIQEIEIEAVNSEIDRALAGRIIAALRAQLAPVGGLSQAARDVLAERQRQISVEDFGASYDDMATRGQLAGAAAPGAMVPDRREVGL